MRSVLFLFIVLLRRDVWRYPQSYKKNCNVKSLRIFKSSSNTIAGVCFVFVFFFVEISWRKNFLLILACTALWQAEKQFLPLRVLFVCIDYLTWKISTFFPKRGEHVGYLSKVVVSESVTDNFQLLRCQNQSFHFFFSWKIA